MQFYSPLRKAPCLILVLVDLHEAEKVASGALGISGYFGSKLHMHALISSGETKIASYGPSTECAIFFTLQMHGARRLLIVAERYITNLSIKTLEYALIYSDLQSWAS